jgi:hypothetical protein
MFQIPTFRGGYFQSPFKSFGKYSSDVGKYSFVIGPLKAGTNYLQAY